MVSSVTHLREDISVKGSVPQIERRLEAYLESLRSSNGVARLRLRVPLLVQGINLDREVRVEAWRDRDDQNLNDLIRIRWSAEGSAVFPAFTGTLVVWGEGDRKVSYIELDGTYEPPLGTAGAIFDEAIGRRIAESAAREFLGDIRRGLDAARPGV